MKKVKHIHTAIYDFIIKEKGLIEAIFLFLAVSFLIFLAVLLAINS